MKRFFNILVIVSVIGFIVFVSLFIRAKNIEIAKTNELIKQSTMVNAPTPPPSTPGSNQIEKKAYNPGVEYEITAAVFLGLLIISLIGRKIANSKGEFTK